MKTRIINLLVVFIVSMGWKTPTDLPSPPAKPLSPMVSKDHPVNWFFVFKFNPDAFPSCSGAAATGTACMFGGKVHPYAVNHSQQYAVASDAHPELVKGDNCLGATMNDPLGATFSQVYLTDTYNYVIWNDQFYDHPDASKGAPWGHSKGMLAWDNNGDGFVMQVTTPSWPASGSSKHPRKSDGNTLGCVNDNNIEFSQHFFCLKINKADLVALLKALANASVVTDPDDLTLVKNGGPADVQALVKQLGILSDSPVIFKATLSSNVKVFSKPHSMQAPPWQLISSELDAVPLRVASWWNSNKICSTTATTSITCWPAGMKKPGPVQIATSGKFGTKTIGLLGGGGSKGNHAKFGVSINSPKHYAIFGDMNQEGTLTSSGTKKCNMSQNPRGGLFFVVENAALHSSITSLLNGETAPTQGCGN